MLPISSWRRPRRYCSGRVDLLVIGIIGLLISLGFVYLLFKIIGHSEEHVEKVRKTKVLYTESLAWRADSKMSEGRIVQDLVSNPNKKVGKYSDLNLSEKGLEQIGRMHRLQELHLARSIVEDSWLRHLTNLPLKTIHLHGTKLTDKGIVYILRMKDLTSVTIGDTEVTDKGIEELASSKNIVSIQINQGRKITNNGIKYIGTMTQLEDLDIGSSRFTGECFEYLTGLHNLSGLNFENMTVKAKEIKPLTQLKNLVKLNLANTGLDDKALSEISKLESLRFLVLSDNNFTDKGLNALTRLKKLAFLNIKDCPRLTEGGIAQFEKSLPGCRVKYSKTRSLDFKVKKYEQQIKFLESEVKGEMEKAKDLEE